MTQARAYRMSARARDMEETRQRILAAARQFFLDRSFPDVTLDDIAEGSGVTRQTVLNHFESKDGVFLAAAETVIGALTGILPLTPILSTRSSLSTNRSVTRSRGSSTSRAAFSPSTNSSKAGGDPIAIGWRPPLPPVCRHPATQGRGLCWPSLQPPMSTRGNCSVAIWATTQTRSDR